MLLGFFATYETDCAPSFTCAPGARLISEVANVGVAGDFEIEVDASQQIAARVTLGTSSIYVYTRGFIDRDY